VLTRLPVPARLALVLAGLTLPFVTKPVHIDDANFLWLARGARADLWRPHAVAVNWQGRMEPAFDVLSNPPGIGWLLAAVVEAPVWVQHLSLLPWLVLAALGAHRLGERLGGGKGPAAVLLLCGAPSAVLAAQSLTPDLPLLACVLAGLGGLASGPGAPARTTRWPWALVAGAAVLFRYSGLAMVPLVGAWALLEGDRRAALRWTAAAALPAALLFAHDLHAYGAIHFVAMMDFQDVATTPRDTLRKALAALATLGGALVLPVLCWSRWRAAAVGLGVGLAGGALAAGISALTGLAAASTVLACGAGGAALAGGLGLRSPRERSLSLWLLGGFVFLLQLRFTAARYWLPFAAPAVILPLRLASPRLVAGAVGATTLLSLGLSVADLRFARAQESLAARVVALVPDGPRRVAGHWGFQHHLERAGWIALEEDAPVQPGTVIARSAAAWPQEPAPICTTERGRFTLSPGRPTLRVHTTAGRANLHAYLISADPPLETYAPWSLGADPWDVVTVEQVVDCAGAGPPPDGSEPAL
jgi:hypothetical protein